MARKGEMPITISSESDLLKSAIMCVSALTCRIIDNTLDCIVKMVGNIWKSSRDA